MTSQSGAKRWCESSCRNQSSPRHSFITSARAQQAPRLSRQSTSRTRKRASAKSSGAGSSGPCCQQTPKRKRSGKRALARQSAIVGSSCGSRYEAIETKMVDAGPKHAGLSGAAGRSRREPRRSRAKVVGPPDHHALAAILRGETLAADRLEGRIVGGEVAVVDVDRPGARERPADADDGLVGEAVAAAPDQRHTLRPEIVGRHPRHADAGPYVRGEAADAHGR